MLVFKIIACIVIGFVGFNAFLHANSLGELREKATKAEKKSLDVVESVAVILPLLVICFIMAK
jgi:uncharacterized membrane protein SpoIIM required for sporulation